MPPYTEQFPVGSSVRIADRKRLGEFRQTWHFHHPLGDDQLPFAGQRAVVRRVGFYHGGDVLYELSDVPGIWHEGCLEPSADNSRMTTRQRIFAACIGIAVCVWPLAVYAIMWSRTVPITFPVDLRVGSTRSPESTVHAATAYQVELEVDTPVPDELRCLFLGTLDRECAADTSLDVSWQILRQAKVVGSGRSRAEPGGTTSGGGAVSRVLGWQRLDPGEGYTVELSSTRDASALQSLKPRVRLAMRAGAKEEYLEIPSLVAFVELIIGAVSAGGVLLVVLVKRAAA